MKTATKLLKKKKKEARKISRQLGGVLIVIARLEKRRVKLTIMSPEIVFWLESLRGAREIVEIHGRAD